MALLGGLASLEQAWPCWKKFATLRTQAMPNTQLYLLPADEDAEFSSLGPCQPAHCHAFCHDHNRL